MEPKIIILKIREKKLLDKCSFTLPKLKTMLLILNKLKTPDFKIISYHRKGVLCHTFKNYILTDLFP